MRDALQMALKELVFYRDWANCPEWRDESQVAILAIRKVLGSSIKSIIELLSGKFVSLLLIANLLALPVSWYLANSWLNNFYYRIELSFWPFIISFCVCLFFTAISLLFHAIQAAKANPIESLKYE